MVSIHLLYPAFAPDGAVVVPFEENGREGIKGEVEVPHLGATPSNGSKSLCGVKCIVFSHFISFLV
jgi:hypothetical protein